ncbi:hypothetical protein [Nitrosospira multiformis]|uniref:hypothetical protein n=1 Tax=Nitrosospira multiformis TaxID=1231 RepID=UPI0011B27E5B|nr:hypothetical protein [Nitrosospira multiformis]
MATVGFVARPLAPLLPLFKEELKNINAEPFELKWINHQLDCTEQTFWLLLLVYQQKLTQPTI